MLFFSFFLFSFFFLCSFDQEFPDLKTEERAFAKTG